MTAPKIETKPVRKRRPAGPMSRAELYPRRRRLTVQPCPKCGAWIYSGWDDDIAAMHARAEPALLSALGEIAAVAWGRRTYAVDQGRLLARYRPGAIPSRPADMPVVAEHKCGEPIPESWKAELPAPRNGETNDEYIPF